MIVATRGGSFRGLYQSLDTAIRGYFVIDELSLLMELSVEVETCVDLVGYRDTHGSGPVSRELPFGPT